MAQHPPQTKASLEHLRELREEAAMLEAELGIEPVMPPSAAPGSSSR